MIDKTSQTIKLKDGRLLGYAEYGAPQGKPLIFFHGHIGSRLDFRPNDAIAHSLGARVIAIDRPVWTFRLQTRPNDTGLA